ncbi:YraN family protein [Candidatus Saccharibacteria bacterium]|nr:YraN family protein [Candidatus Saccharibacteria bacterium]
MKTTVRGNQAETAVAQQLIRKGYEITAQNWKTSRCEIDIVAKKRGIIYFIEVKYRSTMAQGAGLEYITPSKLRRLHFSAKVWTQYHGWEGDWRLLAAAVTTDGQGYVVQEIIELE